MKRLITTALLATGAMTMSGQQVSRCFDHPDLADGVARYRQGQYAAAIASLDRYMEDCDGAATVDLSDAMFYRLASLMKVGRGDADISLLRYLELYPESSHRSEAYALLGNIYLDRKEYERASYYFGKIDLEALPIEMQLQAQVRHAYALMQMPNKEGRHSEIRHLLSFASKGKGDWQKKARFYLAVLDFKEGNYAEARRALSGVEWPNELADEAEGYLGQIDFAEGKWAAAVETIEHLWHSRADLRTRRELQRAAGLSYFRLEDYESAARILGQYMEDNPTDTEPELACALGISLFRAGRFEQAEYPLSAATSGKTHTASMAALYLGQTRVELDKSTEAVLAFEQAEANKEASPEVREAALYNMAVCLGKSGSSFGQAVSVAERFFAEFPNSKYREDIATLLTESYYTSKDYRSSLNSIEKIGVPTQSILVAKQYVLSRLGDVAMDAHRLSEAEAYYSRALDIQSEKFAPEALLGRSQAKYQSDRFASAAEDAKQYIHRYARIGNKNLIAARYTLGYALFNQKQFALAYSAFADLVNTPGISVETIADARTRMGDCLYIQKRLSEAEKMYQMAINQSPTTGATALYRLSEIHGYKGEYAKQISAIDQYLSNYPTAENAAELLYNKGRAAVVGQLPEAVGSLKKVLQEFPETRWARMAGLELAMLHHHKGKTEDAIAQYKEVIEKYPQSDEARQALSDLRVIYLQADRAEEFADYVERTGAKRYADELVQTEKLLFEQAETRYRNGAANAAEAFESFIKKHPKGAEADKSRLYLAKIYSQARRDDEAVELLKALNDKMVLPELRSEAQAMLGQIFANRQDYDQALDLYRQAYRSAASPSAFDSYAMEALQIATQARKYETLHSIAQEVKASGKIKDQDRVSLLEAKALHALHKSKEAVLLLHSINKDINTSLGAEALVTLGQIKYEIGDLKTSKELCDNFIKQSTPQQYWLARAFILLADIYTKMGQPETAKQYLLSLKKNYNGNEADIKEMIDSRLD